MPCTYGVDFCLQSRTEVIENPLRPLLEVCVIGLCRREVIVCVWALAYLSFLLSLLLSHALSLALALALAHALSQYTQKQQQ